MAGFWNPEPMPSQRRPQPFGASGPVTGTPGPVTGTPGPVTGTPGPVTGTPGPVTGTPGPVTTAPVDRMPMAQPQPFGAAQPFGAPPPVAAQPQPVDLGMWGAIGSGPETFQGGGPVTTTPGGKGDIPIDSLMPTLPPRRRGGGNFWNGF